MTPPTDDETIYESGMCNEWKEVDEYHAMAIKIISDFDGWLRDDLTIADVKDIVLGIARRIHP